MKNKPHRVYLPLSSLIEEARRALQPTRDADLAIQLDHITSMNPGALGGIDAACGRVQKIHTTAVGRTKIEENFL